MAKKRKRVDYDSPLMSIYSPEYQYLMRQNAPENANVAGLGDWLSNLFNRNKQQPDFHRDTVSMGLGTENSLQGVGNGGTDWNNQNFSLTNQQQFNYDPNQELTTSQQYQSTLKDPENLAPKQTGEQTIKPSVGSNVNWGGIISSAGTSAANAIQEGGSAADIAAGIMGIPVLAKMWKANTEWGDARIKEAQEKIANPSVKYIQDANDIQGAGQGIKLNNQKDLNLIDTSGMLNTNNWKKFSSGRGSGTWWKNMATAQFQGAAAGSAGGPWGALGGATAGLLGSIGGLFGSKKRAKRAMKQYNDNMTTLRNYATMENQRRITERNLSNQNMLSNAMTSQKLQDMANFKAFGGDIDLSPNMMNLWNDKQNIDKQKVMNQQMNFGLGNSFNQKLNTFDYGGYTDFNNYANAYKNSIDEAERRDREFRNVYRKDWGRRTPVYANYTEDDFIRESNNSDNPDVLGLSLSEYNKYKYRRFLNYPNENVGTAYLHYPRNMNEIYNAIPDSELPIYKDKDGYWYLKQGIPHPNNDYDNIPSYDDRERGVIRNKKGDLRLNSKDVKLYKETLKRTAWDNDFYNFVATQRENEENEENGNNSANKSNNIGNNSVNNNSSTIPNLDEIVANYMKEHNIGNNTNTDNTTISRKPSSDLTEKQKEYYNKKKQSYSDFNKDMGFVTKDDVKRFQEAYNKTHNDKLKVDGLTGDKTIKAYQRWANELHSANNEEDYERLKIDGFYGKKSRKSASFDIINRMLEANGIYAYGGKLNTFDYGGSMNGMNLPTGMQSYENGGTHEENPYGGIQVGQDQQGNPNLVEEGEFRWGDYIFSDRIPVDYSILSDFNVEKGKNNRNTKNNPTYAELAKKTADKYKDLNDKISKDSLNKQLDRLQQSQEAQKFKEQQDQQYADYTNALKSPTQGNPMYGNMKYNGMGNANQGLNAGVDEGMGNAMDNSDLSNVNRSGNPMMAAYGGNIFAAGSTMYNPYKILPVETLPGGNQILYGKPMSNLELPLSLPTKLNNPLVPNRELTLVDATPEQKQIILNNLGYNTGGIGNGWGEKSKAAWDNFIYDQTHPNTQYGSTQAYAQNTTPYQKTKTSETVGTSTKVATKTPMQVTLKDENTSNENIKAINGDESAVNNTMAVSGKGPQEPVSVDHDLGRTAAGISDYTDPTVPMYNDSGYWANLAKGIMPNLMNWSGQANWKYDPKWKPSNELEALGHSSYSSRIADHLGDYIAPNLMDVERLNNQAMAQTAAQQRGIQNTGGGNRGFVAAQNAATDYNGQMGIGNNYTAAEQYNAEQKQKTAEFNRATNQFNAQANNDMYKDNLTAWMQGRQMDIQAMEAANRERQFERQYKDKVDRDAALNRSSDLGAMTDNMIDTIVGNALYNRGLNNTNTKLNNRYYFDKDKGWTYKGDTGIGRQINEYAKAKDVRLTSDDYTQINNILKEDPHNIAGIEGVIDARRVEQNKQDIKDFNDKHNSIIADFDNYSNLLDDALFSDIYKNEDRLAFNKARDKYEEVINNKNSTSSQKEEAYYDFKNKVNQMKNKYSLYKGMVDSQRNKSFDLTPEEYAALYEKRQKDNKNAYGGKINTRKHREYDYMEI